MKTPALRHYPLPLLLSALLTACGSDSTTSPVQLSGSSVCERLQNHGIAIPAIDDGINTRYASTFDGNCSAFQAYQGSSYQSTVNGITTTIHQEANGDYVLIKDGTATTGTGSFQQWVAFRFHSEANGDVLGEFYQYQSNSTNLQAQTTYYRDGRARYDFSTVAPDTYYFPGPGMQRFITDFGYVQIGPTLIHNGYTVITVQNRTATEYLGCEGDLSTLSSASASALSATCDSNTATPL